MFVSEFTGDLDIRVRLADRVLQIRAAGDRVAVSRRLMEDLQVNPHVTYRDGVLVIDGIDRNGAPQQVTYREVGFDPTAHPDANEGGFLLLEREPG